MNLPELAQLSIEKGNENFHIIEKFAQEFDFSKKPECKNWLLGDKYIKGLLGLCEVLLYPTVTELGTMYGNSTVAFSFGGYYTRTYDIDTSNWIYGDLLDVERIKLNGQFDFLNIDYSVAQLIFCDIGDHTGVEEEVLHKKLLEIKWQGVVAYDDINWGMRAFWDTIEQEKIELDWHSGGFGLVRYV